MSVTERSMALTLFLVTVMLLCYHSFAFTLGGSILSLQSSTAEVIGSFDLVSRRLTSRPLWFASVEDNDGYAETESAIASASDLNHGLYVYNSSLYASSSTTVYRWPYTEGIASIRGKICLYYERYACRNAFINNFIQQGKILNQLMLKS
jgi:hypothetical protein